MNLNEKIESVRTYLFDPGASTSDFIIMESGACSQSFEYANFYQSPGGEAYEVHGLIRDKYLDFHEMNGDLGFPISDETDDPQASGGRMNVFEHGIIHWDPYDGVYVTLNTSTGSTGTMSSPNDESGSGNHPNESDNASNSSSYPSQAQTAYDDIINDHPALAADQGAAGGHSTSQEVFSPEFDRLQKLLTKVTFWTGKEETARTILVAYAKDEVGKLLSFIPDNIMYQLERIGLSESNQKAVSEYQKILQRETGITAALPSLTDFGIYDQTRDWCGQTQSFAFKKALQAHKVAMNNSWDSWITEANRSRKAANTPLEPGDWFTMVSLSSPHSGHIGGCIQLQDDVLYYVSGNAGGGAAAGEGTVRVDKVTVETPPANYKYGSYPDTAPKQPGISCPADKGVIWLISVIKLSAVDFANLDSIAGDASALSSLGLVKKIQ